MKKTELYFPAHINADTDEVYFIKTSEKELELFPFLDSRFNKNKTFSHKCNIANIDNNLQYKKVSYLFHTSFCGSTLLARLLGSIDDCFSLSEPNIIMQLANFERVNPKFKNNKILLEKWFNKIEFLLTEVSYNKKHTIIKPTNATNNLIKTIIKASENSKVLMLYSDLESFLVSILKKGESGKAYIRNLYNILSLDKSPYAFNDFRKVNCFTDLQIACLVWSMQIYEYNKIIDSSDSKDVRVLDSKDFLSYPLRGLTSIAQYFDIELTEQKLNAIHDKGVFSSHSKNIDEEYNSNIRTEENVLIKNKYQSELKEIKDWVENILKAPLISSSALHLKL